MKATCGGKEIDIPEEVAQRMEEALTKLKEEQDKLIRSERYLTEQKSRRRWSDLGIWEKVKVLFGWNPNGGEEGEGGSELGNREDVHRTNQGSNSDNH